MSEYQNRVMAYLTSTKEELPTNGAQSPGARVVLKAIQLYYALGGDGKLLQSKDLLNDSPQPARVDEAVGELMFELAQVSHTHDLDLIQAAYNTLDGRVAASQEVPVHLGDK